jgi:hypothetical protein
MAREHPAQDKTKRKTGSSTNPRDDPNQIRVTLTTLTKSTYHNGEEPDSEQEFYWGMSVTYLVERDRETSAGPRPLSPPAAGSKDLPNPPRLAQVQRGEMRGYERSVKLKQSTRKGTHTRFRRQASESGGERCVPRDASEDAISLARRLPHQREDLSSLTSFSNPFGEPPSGDGLLQNAASESGGKRTTRRRLKESCKTLSPSSPDTTQNPLFPRTQ